MLTFKGNFTGVMSIPFTIKNTLPELVNTSTVSSEEINFGETVTLSSSAEGGMGKYLYAVVYKKNTDKKWTWVQTLSEETSVEIKPARKAEYTICSKVKDETGNVVKKFFKVSVK